MNLFSSINMQSTHQSVTLRRPIVGLRAIALTLLLIVVGLVLCGWEYGTMFWGNWLHSTTFNLGVLAICTSAAFFVGNICARRAGLFMPGLLAFVITAYVLAIVVFIVLWSFPGWSILHALMSKCLAG